MNTSRARRYNEARAHTPAQIDVIARALGVDVRLLMADLAWTDTMLRRVADWQRAQGLGADGMIGPLTLARMEQVLARGEEVKGEAAARPLMAASPAAGGGGYDHAYDPADPSRGGWPKVDAQWEEATATGSWLAGMLRLLTGRTVRQGGVVTYSRGPDDFISLDTYSVGIAHWWAETAPSKLLAPLCARWPDEAAAAWGGDRLPTLRDPAALRRLTGTTRGHMRFGESRLRWLLDGWWEVARRPHWLAAQVEVWAQDYIGEALAVASAAGVVWGDMSAADCGRSLAAIARMCNTSPVMARAVVRRWWGGRGSLVEALRRAYTVDRADGGYSTRGNGPSRWSRIEAMCAVSPSAEVFARQWAEAVRAGINTQAAPVRARGV